MSAKLNEVVDNDDDNTPGEDVVDVVVYADKLEVIRDAVDVVADDPVLLYKTPKRFGISHSKLANAAMRDIDSVRKISVPAPVRKLYSHSSNNMPSEAPLLSEISGEDINFCIMPGAINGMLVPIDNVPYLVNDYKPGSIHKYGDAAVNIGSIFGVCSQIANNRIILIYSVDSISQYMPSTDRDIAQLDCTLVAYQLVSWRGTTGDVGEEYLPFIALINRRMKSTIHTTIGMESWRILRKKDDIEKQIASADITTSYDCDSGNIRDRITKTVLDIRKNGTDIKKRDSIVGRVILNVDDEDTSSVDFEFTLLDPLNPGTAIEYRMVITESTFFDTDSVIILDRALLGQTKSYQDLINELKRGSNDGQLITYVQSHR